MKTREDIARQDLKNFCSGFDDLYLLRVTFSLAEENFYKGVKILLTEIIRREQEERKQ